MANQLTNDVNKPDSDCQRPTKLDPCGAPCMQICGTKNPSLTCRPAGRQWGRACGPVLFSGSRWTTPSKVRLCKQVKIRGQSQSRMPYGFGLYARKLYPEGLPCAASFNFPEKSCNNVFYPLLPTKPAKLYSNYTFSTHGAPYTCPRPCVANCQK
jgi:hypothetical protein